MPVVPNLWSGAANNIVKAMYGDPVSAADAASIDLNREKTRGERMKNDSLEGLDATLGGLGGTPESYNENLAAALGSLVRGGVNDPGKTLTPFLAGRAMIAPDAMSDTLGRGALITSGSSPSEGFATNTRRADAISARDASESLSEALAVERAKPLSETQVRGNELLKLPDDERQRAVRFPYLPTSAQEFEYSTAPGVQGLAEALTPQPPAQDFASLLTTLTAPEPSIASSGPAPSYTDFLRQNQAAQRPYESEWDKRQAVVNADFLDALAKRVQSDQDTLITNNEIRGALERGAATGFGENWLLELRKGAGSFGLDVDPTKISDQELIRATGNRAAMVLRNPAGGAGLPGAASDRDVRFLVASVPNLQNTPQGNLKLIEMADRKHQWDLDVLNFASDMIARNGGQPPMNFQAQIANYAEAHPLLTPQDRAEIEALASVTSMGPANPAAPSPAPAVKFHGWVE